MRLRPSVFPPAFLLAAALCSLPIAGALAQSDPTAPPQSSAPSASSSAPAALSSSVSAPQQVVWLRSGGIVRGEVIEFVPDARVVLLLATGEIRTIQWDQVERASWLPTSLPPPRKTEPPKTPGSAAPTSRSPLVPAASSAGVLLHLVGDRKGLQLEERPRYGPGSWTPLCNAPCGTVLDLHRKSLRVTGPDVRPSNAFHIDERIGEETLDVSVGSEDLHRWGQRSLVAGIALALAGGIAYGLGRVEDEDAAVVGGIVGMAVGGVGVAIAIPLLGSSGTVVRNGQGDRVGGLAERDVW